ncbi:hypothetical protein [Nonomuraea sp. KM88]|uniref:hypothetical protein n=1 Tax=Nonomuraea sp. KM88 TaxID=3457427 RepID=UPI003FCE2AD4
MEVPDGLDDLRLEFVLIEALRAEAERLVEVGEERRNSDVHQSRPGGHWYA